jgi:uncharacterized protein
MAISNRQRIDQGLTILREGLTPFVERECDARLGDDWVGVINQGMHRPLDEGGVVTWDNYTLLRVMWDQWHSVFRNVLGNAHRSLVSELRDVRNDHAHEKAFTSDRTYRSLDSMKMLLEAVSASEAAGKLAKMAEEVMRVKFAEQARNRTRTAASTTLEGQPAAGLKPWREVITPHPDVAAGNFQQAEFAADLAQVHRGEGTSEYGNPEEFFRRTFITKGLHRLLLEGLKRVSGQGGDPVVELQTNFGGGKTHSMLALYHLFAGLGSELTGMEPLLQEVGVVKAPKANRAVLVGTAIGPAQPRLKEDGTVVNTLWGELAWQLGGAEGYAMIAESDKAGVSPGKDDFLPLFDAFGPCLILIDEWVAYLRQLYKVDGLPGGAFDANLTFAQALTEAVKARPNILLVASLPESQIEIGGEGGQEALVRLKQTFARVQSSWKPADSEEGFEIVRRRLFDSISAPASRDATVKAFGKMYREQKVEFPSDCSEGDYLRRLELAYPIHPELFDLLYEKWSTLDRFQRTRGVLRLMASVIHALWEKEDKNLLIMPSSVPMSDPAVSDEILQYLEDRWDGVVGSDVDGEHSTALSLDRENPNYLGKYSATRRVSRTVFLESAPLVGTGNQGVDARTVKLGCAQPGETVATFGDALRRLSDTATYLYVDGPRNWFDTQPNVTRTAQDRANQLEDADVDAHIGKLLRDENRGQGARGQFSGLHITPEDSADVPDDTETRLVLFGADRAHKKGEMESAGIKAAQMFLEQRGNAPRIYRNAVVFLVPDTKKLNDVRSAARSFLAWESVVRDIDSLNLSAFAVKQSKSKREESANTLSLRIREAWCWCLAPVQEAGSGEVSWDEVRVAGDGSLAARASNKLVESGSLFTVLGGAVLKHHLDKWLWQDKDYLSLNKIRDDFASYLYLPRLASPKVLTTCVQTKLNELINEDFGVADAMSGEEYVGLRTNAGSAPALDGRSVLVQYAVAKAAVADPVIDPNPSPGPDPLDPLPPVEKKLTGYYGSVNLNPARPNKHMSDIVQEITQHMSTQTGAKAKISVRVEIELPNGLDEAMQRTVLENSKALKLDDFGFRIE